MLRESIYIAAILLLSHLWGRVIVKLFMKHVFAPKKKKYPSLRASKFKPFTCQGCMIFWLTLLFLSLYNWHLSGLFTAQYWLFQIIVIILSLINYKTYETLHTAFSKKA
jgi:hypothetical protein